MFDFAPVGLAVAVAGLLFVTLVGWRLLPRHRAAPGTDEDTFRIQEYLSEAQVPAGSKFVGRSVRYVEQLCENELTVMAIVRGALSQDATVPALPLFGIGAVGVSVLAMGVATLRKRG